jgi:iron complex outermembrane receptor protein
VVSQDLPEDLTEMSLEELLTIKVTSVARKEQRLSRTAAAVYVITGEDIRRSGALSIPEALRMAPGLQVARIDSNKWAITSRGFNGLYANKLLVLLDGRTIYTPTFSGVYWDMHDVVLDDIDRIEVIRGPGAVMWGSNAVNGVINIITKAPSETQGTLVTSGTGNQESGFGSVRYGSKIGEHAYYRAYTKYSQRDSEARPSGGAAADDWHTLHGGFRLDWDGGKRDFITIQGSAVNGHAGQTQQLASLQPPFSRTVDDQLDLSGGHLLGRWSRKVSDTSDMALQVYYDSLDRKQIANRERRDTVDIDFHYRSALTSRSELSWGGGYRFTTDQIDGTFIVFYEPPSRQDNLYSGFLQHEWIAVKDRLVVTTGARLEHNSYTGVEVQPNVRLLWTPDERHTGWASVARAVRSPSRTNHNIGISTAVFPGERLPSVLTILGDDEFESENLLAYEAGYRWEAPKRLSLDVATFFNSYDDLVTSEPGRPFPRIGASPPYLVIPVRFSNQMNGETYGVEATASKRILEGWKLSGSYSWLEMQLHADRSSLDSRAEGPEGESPQHQFQLRSYLNLPWKMQFDSSFQYVSSLPALTIPDYSRLDARIGWQPSTRWRASWGLQNILDDRHAEFLGRSGGFPLVEIRRSVYCKLTWLF